MYESNAPRTPGPNAPAIVIQNHMPHAPWMSRWFSRTILFASILANIVLFGMFQQYFPQSTANEQFKSGDWKAPDKIALIRVSGLIAGNAIDAPKRELEQAAKDDGVKCVVLAIDSPGGTISASDNLYSAIAKFKRESKKPLIVSMQGIAASGGYYIAAPADKIIADRSCITGSIGVIASTFTFSELMKKVGVEQQVFKSGILKDSGSPFREMTEKDREEFKLMIATMFDQFVGVVLAHRKEKIVDAETTIRGLEGRIVMAEEAKKLGLIDEVGFEEDAIAAAKQMANLTGEVRVVTYSRPIGSLTDLLLGGKAPGSSFDSLISPELLMELQMPRLMYLPGSFIGAN